MSQQTKLDELTFTVGMLANQMKTNLTAKSHIQQRLSLLESKTSFSNKQNSPQQTEMFTSMLKKVDSNAIANLKKLQEYIKQEMHQMRKYFAQTEKHLLNLFEQKHTILENLNFETEKNAKSISILQQHIHTQQAKDNLLHIVQENITTRIQILSKDIKGKIGWLTESVNLIQGKENNSQNNIKKIRVKIQETQSKISTIQHKMQKNNSWKNNEKQLKEQNIKIEQTFTPNKYNMNNISNSKITIDKNNEIFIRLNKLQETVQSLKQQMQPNEYSFSTEPKKTNSGRTGLKGLLQLSKGPMMKKDPFERQPLPPKKGLPPVKQNAFASKKKQPIIEEQEEVHNYEVDEEGYFIDANGEYVRDEDGQLVKLSPQQMQQLLQQQY